MNGHVRESGSLARDVAIETERGMRSFADGDRVMFLKNERALGVKNGTLGTIESVSRVRMAVQLDDGRSVAFDVKDYGQIDHGYAATIHKAQGMTVDRTYVLATPGMDSHTAYVALSRHRDRVELAYGQDDFADQGKLVRALSRERGKDMVSDYADAQAGERSFAERRGISFRERVVEVVRAVPDKTREAFARIARSLAATVEPAAPVQDVGLAGRIANRVAVERHARAIDVILAGQHEGRSANPAMLDELAGARAALNGRRESAARDMEAAYKKDPSLARDAAAGNIRGAVQAMQLETELRTDPGRRADRFVERWNELRQGADHAYQAGDMSSQKALRGEMAAMVKSLQRDPQMESILAARKQELGIAFSSGRSLGAELAFNHGIDLGRGLGIGM